jgi:catechol 2,3-dioxygenase-like lactoylglutathione lyase family enzyme
MFCPKCKDEFRAGFTRCNDCDVDLVDALPPEEPEPPAPDYVTVLETGDQTLVAVAKSVLDGAGIFSVARNERVQNLFGWGSVGTGYNVAMGPIQVQVMKEDEAVARRLLATLPVPVEGIGDDATADAGDSPEGDSGAAEESDRARLLRCAPYFPVADVKASAEFYERVFGFKAEYLAGDPPEFAICSRDGLPVMLRRVAAPELIRPAEAQGGSWDAFFWVDDALALHAELSARGAEVVYGPVLQEAYQMQEFAVRDRDGHVLGFGSVVGPPPA